MWQSQLLPSELPANNYGSGSLGKRYRPRFTEILVLAVTDLQAPALPLLVGFTILLWRIS